jgi:hypothetical protein
MKKNQILKKMRDDLEEIRDILDGMTEDTGCTCGCGCCADSPDLDNDSEELVDIDEELENFIEKIFNRSTYAVHCSTAKKRMKKVIKAAYKTNGADKYSLFYRLAERIGTMVAAIVRDKTETEVKIFCSGTCRGSLTLIHAWQLKTAITAALMNYAVALQLNLSEIQLRNLNRENIKDVPEIRQMMTGFESVYRIFKNMISVIKVSEDGIEQVLQDRAINTFTDTFKHVMFDILDVMLVAAHREQKHFAIRYSFCMSQLKEVNEIIKEHLHYVFDAVEFNSDDIGSLFKEPPIEEEEDDDESEEYFDIEDDDESDFCDSDEDDAEDEEENEKDADDDAEDSENDDSSDDSEDSAEDSDSNIDEEKI